MVRLNRGQGAATHMNFCFQAQSGKARANGVPKMLGASAVTVSIPVPFLAVTALPFHFPATLGGQRFLSRPPSRTLSSSQTRLGRLQLVQSHGHLCWPPHTPPHRPNRANGQLAIGQLRPDLWQSGLKLQAPRRHLVRQCPWTPLLAPFALWKPRTESKFQVSFPVAALTVNEAPCCVFLDSRNLRSAR